MKKKLVMLVASVVLSMTLLPGCGDKSVEDEDFRFVKVEQYDGDLTMERNDKDIDVSEGMMLQPKDTMYVGDDSEALLLVDSDKHITATANTGLTISAKGDEKKGKVKIDLLYGDAMFVIDNKLNDKSTFEVVTPNATLSVRGTTFQVAYDKDTNSTYVEVAEGIVYADYEGEGQDEEIYPGEVRVIKENDVYNYVDDSVWDMAIDLIEMAEAYDADSAMTDDSIAEADAVDFSGAEGGSKYSQYEYIIENMHSFVEAQPRLRDEYLQYDYMIYDYDMDGEKEIILYLRYYNDEEKYMLDLCFLDYTPAKGAYVYAINTGDVDDSCFYANYKGKLVRYSWNTNPYESYIYSVYASDGKLTYVLEEAFDEIISDISEAGLEPLPLYGEWEMLLEDKL